jgi:hypothetical protein
MNSIRRKLVLAHAVALALLLGACGGEEKPPCANPAAPGCPPSPSPSPVGNASPSPEPTPTPAAFDVTGGWRSLARSWNFSLKQDGSNLSGTVLGFKNVSYDQSDPAVQITGSIDSSGNVAFSADLFGIEFNGVAEPGGLRITGTLRDCAGGCRNYGEILEKQ